MRLLKHNRPGEPFITVDQLTAAEAMLLRQWRSGMKVDLAIVGQIIQKAADRHCWIGCDCQDGEGTSTNPPVLFPARTRDRYTLTRGATSGRAEHADTCPFRWEEGELLGHTAHGPRGPINIQKSHVDFLLYKETNPVAATQTSERKPKGEGGARPHALQTRLFDLLTRAELNVIQNGEQKDGLNAIRQITDEIFILPDFRLSEVTWVTHKAITGHWASEKFKRIAAGGLWPQETPLQGFVITTAKEIRQNKIFITDDLSIDIETPVTVFGAEGEVKAPYLTIISLKYDAKKNRAQPYRAYAHPRYTDKVSIWSYCPVDSNYERAALSALLYVARKAKEQGINVRITKPLFDIQIQTNTPPVRPDFILEYEGQKTVIETMGSDDAEYLTRKVGVHEHMERIGAVFKDERSSVDEKRANSLLIRYAIEWLKVSGAPWQDKQ